MSLRYWIRRILLCKTIEDFEFVLTKFGYQKFSLTDRALISAIYTPRLKKILGEREEKGRILEDCMALCWRVNK